MVAAVAVYLIVRGPDAAVGPTPRLDHATSTRATEDARAAQAEALLRRLGSGLRRGDREEVAALAAPGVPGAARELAVLRDNVRSLGITHLSFRYLHAREAGVVADRRPLGKPAWVGDVRVEWRIEAFDGTVNRMQVPVTFLETTTGPAFVSVRRVTDVATPLWMLERLHVRRTHRSLVVGARRRQPARFSGLADRAVADVRKVLTGWRGRLVVEVPADERELGRVLGSQPDAYAGIAAVTTTVDGSQSPHAPAHVFVNPRVFGPLGPRAAQIVMSHEAAHVATGAAVSSMPTWLLEGFADYVALAHVRIRVTAAASQVLARVRKDGPPSHLPGKVEFDPQNTALGESYEAAWLACRLLAHRYGEEKLVAFYRASDRAGSTRQPFAAVLHTDQRTFTRAWIGYLRRLAR